MVALEVVAVASPMETAPPEWTASDLVSALSSYLLGRERGTGLVKA